MVEWSITPVLKTGVLRGTGGSNPSLSAKVADYQRLFFFTANFTAKKITPHRVSQTIKIAVNSRKRLQFRVYRITAIFISTPNFQEIYTQK